jgi:thiosulfate/3-mercaptopyruvate sulfurtransferase
MAARLWWMLRWVGHEKVAVLDGGFAKWTKEGRPITPDVPLFTPFNYPIRLKGDAAVDVRAVEAGLGKSPLVDARAPVRYRGEQEPIDPVAGRIKGAKNRFNMDNVSAQGTFKSPDELKKEFQSVLQGRSPSEVIHYCGSGVAACHNLLAMELAGLEGGKLYAGSWSEWSADPKRPQDRG